MSIFLTDRLVEKIDKVNSQSQDCQRFSAAFRAISKVFGWVSGDEQALLKQHGIV